jgi:hypothetical protein|tara:strand:+ start:2892 stop:3176 length:285 start_codon:yes stop_codon:yes gene_type:complete
MDLSLITGNLGLLAGGGTAGIVLWVLKKVPNEHICSIVETAFESLGSAMTLGLSKWKVTKGVWNKTIEPWLIDLVDNVVGGAVRGFINGLRSDK